MNPEELAREFEKAPKNLMKAKPQELLFDEDYPEGRMKYVCYAMNRDAAKLNGVVKEILSQPEGTRHLVRALNNLNEIGHFGAICFAEAIYKAVDWDADARLQKLLQILDAVSPQLRSGLDWIAKEAAEWLDSTHLNAENRLKIWMHWCSAELRSSPDATQLIEDICPRRPLNLQKSQANALRDALKDEKSPWDARSAACLLLLGNQIINLEKAQAFVEQAYASFPLEALEGVEILALAVENDATRLAEFDVIQAKLAQIRHDNLYLREMPHDSFISASERVFDDQFNLPGTALELALLLQTRDKNDRLILSAFIDDARRADWLYVAHKANAIARLAAHFFSHFDAENPLIRAFSAELVMTLLDNHNADALLVEAWNDALARNDLDALTAEAKKWADFCNL